jgi:hypothetical protein
MTTISLEELDDLPPDIETALKQGFGIVYPRDTPTVLALPRGAQIESASPNITLEPLEPALSRVRGEQSDRAGLVIVGYRVKIIGVKKFYVKVCSMLPLAQGPVCFFMAVYELVTILVPIY